MTRFAASTEAREILPTQLRQASQYFRTPAFALWSIPVLSPVRTKPHAIGFDTPLPYLVISPGEPSFTTPRRREWISEHPRSRDRHRIWRKAIAFSAATLNSFWHGLLSSLLSCVRLTLGTVPLCCQVELADEMRGPPEPCVAAVVHQLLKRTPRLAPCAFFMKLVPMNAEPRGLTFAACVTTEERAIVLAAK